MVERVRLGFSWSVFLAAVLGIFLIAFSVTLLWSGTSAVLEAGGSCGSGGPYMYKRPCPQGTDSIIQAMFLTGIAGVVISVTALPKVAEGALALISAAWPGFFLAMSFSSTKSAFAATEGGGVDVEPIAIATICLLIAIPGVVAVVDSARKIPGDYRGRVFLAFFVGIPAGSVCGYLAAEVIAS